MVTIILAILAVAALGVLLRYGGGVIGLAVMIMSIVVLVAAIGSQLGG